MAVKHPTPTHAFVLGGKQAPVKAVTMKAPMKRAPVNTAPMAAKVPVKARFPFQPAKPSYGNSAKKQ